MVKRSYPRAREVAELYRRYESDPGSVAPRWREVFEALDQEAREWLASMNGAGAPVVSTAEAARSDGARTAALDSVRALMLIRAYRVRGHLEADLDPLHLAPPQPHPELHPSSYGFDEEDMDRPIYVHGVLGLERATMRQIMHVVRRDYCGTIGLEFMHLQDPDQKDWIQRRMEGVLHRTKVKDAVKLEILERLTAAEMFEKFLHRKYTGTKRFSLEGAESALAALETIVRLGAEEGVEEFVLGMAHRGRLNVLANLMGKPLEAIFYEFQGGAATPEEYGGSGDVKYHLGTSTTRQILGKTIRLSLSPNPSHLEAVDPVVVGRVRARQEQLGDEERAHAVGLLIHGDAAFAAQGVVAETLQFAELDGYDTGGVVHLIINNQIGFTTNPMAARSSPYPSDIAKAIQAPIVHVNGDDPEAVVQAAAFAIEFRQVFKRDVVVDMYCYRRHGHNEADEPAFTQPLMYSKIDEKQPVRELYAGRLVEDGVISEEEVDELVQEWEERLRRGFERADAYKPSREDWSQGCGQNVGSVDGSDQAPDELTGVDLDTLREIGTAITTVPDDLAIHRKIKRILKSKRKIFESGEGLDWAMGEALAFGSLLIEGYRVRLSGEDSNRGTFSQRHASWVDQETEERYVALNHIRQHQEQIEVIDSPLSEFGVLGFEYGYAMNDPMALVLWEAQFGDFANGAQVIIDQFIASGESKWLCTTGLVLLLPHGYEGQGPEHSSARLERFLQLCAQQNLQVVNCTTPANYFHVLRRQLHRDFRKPLVIMTPKSLLRHKAAVSNLQAFGPDTRFLPILRDEVPVSEPDAARQLVLCSGKVYYDLAEARAEREIDDIHLLRLEQLYPFPEKQLEEELSRYVHCRLVWCQEEPRNMGGWTFLAPRLEAVAQKAGCQHPEPRYAGRVEAASPATGTHERHQQQQARLVEEALTVEESSASRRGRSARKGGVKKGRRPASAEEGTGKGDKAASK